MAPGTTKMAARALLVAALVAALAGLAAAARVSQVVVPAVTTAELTSPSGRGDPAALLAVPGFSQPVYNERGLILAPATQPASQPTPANDEVNLSNVAHVLVFLQRRERATAGKWMAPLILEELDETLRTSPPPPPPPPVDSSVGKKCPEGWTMVPQADQQPRCMPRPVRPIGKMALPFYNMRVWDALDPGYNPVLPPPGMPGVSRWVKQPALTNTGDTLYVSPVSDEPAE